jgi:hypothetical protein
MRKVTAGAAATAATLSLAALAAPAQAADGDTTVELTVVDGELAIVTTAIASGVTSEIAGTSRTLTAPLGLTTVSDTRAASTGWTLSASTTPFTVVGGTASIPASAATFSLLAEPTNVLGSNTYSGTATAGSPSSGTLTTAAADGMNTAEMTPVLHVAVPNSAVAGVYTGTVTQSAV